MERIDRLGWVAGISIRVCGLRLGVRVNDASVMPQIIERLPPGWAPESGYVEMLYSLFVGGKELRGKVRRFNLTYMDSGRLARTLDLEVALDMLEEALDFYVSTEARRRVFVHAGAVTWRGKGIVIPGKSNSGKSSLVAELVRLGARYYSDERAVLDAKGRLHPYPRPLTIYSKKAGKRIRRSVSDLGGEIGVKPAPVALIVASEYQRGAQWRGREVSSGQGVLTLLANTVPIRHRPAEALSTMEQVVQSARVLQGPRGEARETAKAILQEMDSL